MKLTKFAALGAEVSGIDLSKPLDPSMGENLRDSLTAHGVLVFRDQGLSGDQLLSIARLFGDLFVQPIFSDAYQELLILTNDEKRPPVLNTFHQDMTRIEMPAR